MPVDNDELNQDQILDDQEHVNHDGDDHDDDDDEGRPVVNADDAGPDADEAGLSEEEKERRLEIRERRKQERKRRKESLKEREESLRRELAARDRQIQEQNERLAALERRGQGADMANLDAAIRQTSEQAEYFKSLIAQAATKNDGATVADATEKMITFRNRAQELTKLKSQLTNQKQTQAPTAPDPRLVAHAQGWLGKNKWYDPSGKDMDSRLTLTIDTAMAEEGWDPKTPEYWDELSARVKKVLPHRAKDDSITPRKQSNESRRSTVSGSGRESSSSTGGQGEDYQVSAARVQALKDAGMWEDPTVRADAIKRFREHDRANSAKR